MKYECFDLDPALKLDHGNNELLFATDDLAEACAFVYKRFSDLGVECAVLQPSTGMYREIYRIPSYHSKRDKVTGRFIK